MDDQNARRQYRKGGAVPPWEGSTTGEGVWGVA